MMTPSGNARAALGGFLLLFVTSRLLYLVLIDPSHLFTWRGEEIYRGTIAQELLTGLSMPFTGYRADNYSGGSLVIGALAAGFFWLFGPTVFALKLAPLLVFTLALVFWYWTIWRAAGERVAWYFAVLFCFSPPLFTDFSVTAMGFHSESVVLSALTLFLLFKVLSNETGSPALPALLGLVAGFGLWFTYIYGLTLLVMLGFWVWHDKGELWRPRVLWCALGFVMGFAPWIIINVQTHFAGLLIRETPLWEHFRLTYLLNGLAHPRQLSLYEFFADIASDDRRDLPRRAVNLLYSLLYLVPILTAGVLRLKTPFAPAGPHPTRPSLVEFGILYFVVFALAVQFSDFRATRYHLPAYPFLFFLVAYSLARCQGLVPLIQRRIQTVVLASVVVVGLGTHVPMLSLDRPGYTLSVKGYAYAGMPWIYLFRHATAGPGPGDREFTIEVVQRPFLSVLSKLSSDDQRDLSGALVQMLADSAPLNGQAKEFSKIERLVPPGFDRQFYYQVGGAAMFRHRNDLPRAVAAVEFVRHRSAAAHRLALIGIYRAWPRVAALNRSPEALVNSPTDVAPELLPHHWRAIGQMVSQSWSVTERSSSLLNARVQSFVPRLDPSVQRAFLQGVGQALFTYPGAANWLPPADLERFPEFYREGLFEGWGMAMGEDELFSESPWRGDENPVWIAATKGLSARSLSHVRQGRAQFEALFEGPAR